MRRSLGALFTAVAACARPAPTVPPARPEVASPLPPEPAAPAPARYLLTEPIGPVFDQSEAAGASPGRVPAIVWGRRVMLDNGVVVGVVVGPEDLTGFRSLPPRLGGGFVVWSESRTYRGAEFLGDLRPIVDVGATGGVRPWFGTFWLRTPVGPLEVDPVSLRARRVQSPGLSDLVALDARVGVRVDLLGRAAMTVDGGASWSDLVRERGFVASGLQEERGGTVLLEGLSSSPALRLGPTGELRRPAEVGLLRPRDAEPPRASPLLAALPISGRSVPSAVVADAMIGGALLAGGRVLTARQGGLRVLSTSTALPLADDDLVSPTEELARCQPRRLGATVVLACMQDRGAVLLRVDEAPHTLSLEAAFVGAGVFLGGPHDRLGFTGRCGPESPRSLDVEPARARADGSEPRKTDTTSGSPGEVAPDEARFCVRTASGSWVERRISGEEARHVYRWIPGDDGTVTALLLGEKADDGDRSARARRAVGGDRAHPKLPAKTQAATPVFVSEGVRVVRLDPDDPALEGGAFPAVHRPMRLPPYRSIDEDFWHAPDGSIHGWVDLPLEPSAGALARRVATASGALAVSDDAGGRSAGVRIEPDGRLTVLPLPAGVSRVLHGGPFALALARRAGALDTWFESVDGGGRWSPVEAPPLPVGGGEREASVGCGPPGCSLGGGVVRLGWGSAAPVPAEAEVANALLPASTPFLRTARPLGLTCRLGADLAPAESSRPASGAAAQVPPGASARTPPPASSSLGPLGPSISLHSTGSHLRFGSFSGHTWTAELVSPFLPGLAPRRVSLTDPSLDAVVGSVAPLLAASPAVELLLVLDKRRLRPAAAGARALPFDVHGAIVAAADGPGGSLLALDADRGIVFLARGDAASPLLHLARIPDVGHVRLTLGRRGDGAVALIGYSTASGTVFAGELSLGRAEVAPLTALAGLETLEDPTVCAPGPEALRFVADVPVALRLVDKAGAALVDQPSLLATALVAGSPGRLCLLGIELPLRTRLATGGVPAELSASFLGAGEAAVRVGGTSTRAVCALASR